MIIAISNGLKQTETLAAVAAAAAATMVRSGNRQREKQQNAQRQGGKDPEGGDKRPTGPAARRRAWQQSMKQSAARERCVGREGDVHRGSSIPSAGIVRVRLCGCHLRPRRVSPRPPRCRAGRASSRAFSLSQGSNWIAHRF